MPITTNPPVPKTAQNPLHDSVHEENIDVRALCAVLLAVGLGALDTAIANTALPSIGADLHASASDSVWIINAYQLSIVATLLPLAALGDLLGPRRVFLGGLMVFTLASLCCALSHDLRTLTLARWVQGFGAAGIMSVNLALIKQLFPKARLGRGVGLNALVVGIAFTLGPTVSSLVLLFAPWQMLFGLNVPLGLVATFFAWPALPRTVGSAQNFDPLTAVGVALAFGSLIFGLTAAAQRENFSYWSSFMLIGVLLLIYLLRREEGHPASMLPLDLLRRPMFALSALTSVTSFAAQGLAFVALPFYFEHTLHKDPVQTGLLITVWAVLVTVAAPVAGRLSDKYPPGLLGGVGLGVLSLGFVTLTMLPSEPTTFDIVWRMALCGAGFGGFQSPNLRAIMTSAPSHRSGGASGVIAMGRLLGQTSGAALVALCLGLAGSNGPLWALGVGAVFSALAACASLARLWVD